MAPVTPLLRVPLFAGLRPPELEEIARRLVPRLYRRGQVVFHQGDPGGCLYIIERGSVKVSLLSETGEEALLAIMGAGDFFGELALIDGQPRSATVIALADTRACTLDHQSFLAFFGASPEAAVAVCGALAARLRQMNQRFAEVISLDLPGRLAKCLLELAERNGEAVAEGVAFELPLSQREIGELVGASRQSVNRALAQWEHLGLLRRRHRRIVLVRPDALQRRIVPRLS